MKIWSHNALDEAPPGIRNGWTTIVSELQEHGTQQYPRLLEVAPDQSGDCDRYAFEIASGLLMQIVHEPHLENDDFFSEAASSAIEATRQAGRLASGALVMARQLDEVIGRAQRAGLPVTMHRLDIAEPDRSAGPDDAGYLAGFQTLASNLRPTVEWLLVDSRQELERDFQASMVDLRSRRDTRSALQARGADGVVDALALALILADSDPAGVFDRLRESDRLRLAGGGSLIWNDGHLLSAYVSSKRGFGWYGGTLSIHGKHIPETLAIHMAGKPASLLTDLPEMTGGVTIIEIVNRWCGDHPYADVTLDLPRHLVNTTERRHWPE